MRLMRHPLRPTQSTQAVLCKVLLAASALCGGVLPAAARAGERYEGTAYAAGSERVQYRESHWIEGDRHLVLYRCTDGKPFARKLLTQSGSATSPDFEMHDARTGYREGVRSTVAGRQIFLKRDGNAAVKTPPLKAAGAVIDAGFDAFVRGAWDKLANKADVAVPFVVPSRLGAMDFKVRQTSGNTGVRSFGLSLGAWFGAVLPHIDVDYSAARQLLRYRGISNLRDAAGKQMDVDIRFPAAKRIASDGPALNAASRLPLVERCAP